MSLSPHRPEPSPGPRGRPAPGPAHPAIRARRSAYGTTVNLVARVGTAVTLAALMVVLGTAYAALDGGAAPTGATTVGR